jgi:hypothetical protein
MPAIASLEDLRAAQNDLRSMFLAVTPYDLRLTLNGNEFTLCALHYALCVVLVCER